MPFKTSRRAFHGLSRSSTHRGSTRPRLYRSNGLNGEERSVEQLKFSAEATRNGLTRRQDCLGPKPGHHFITRFKNLSACCECLRSR